MNAKGYFIGTVLLAALVMPLTGWACGAPDTTTHVGGLMGIDKAAKTFTILDMQSGSPIHFVADDELLARVEGAQGVLQVQFEEQGGQLRAIGVNY